ncbi:MAG: succinyl transferase OpgC [Proteobacteria bacterium]|nr:succinyl transferase OpgC [Pseudomonadota bacterium]
MRNQKIDFFRGLALIMIFIDHVYNNRLGGYTLRGYGVADAAEIFFFSSGFVSGIVYTKIINRTGFAKSQLKATLRSVQIYIFHVITFLLLVGITVLLKDFDAVETVVQFRNLSDAIYDETYKGLYIFTLGYQPFLFSILPTYVLISIATPAFIILLRKSSWLLFSLSFLLYAFVQIYPAFNITQAPYNSPWVFNPFAYQFLFVIGILFSQAKDLWTNSVLIKTETFIVAILLLLLVFVFHKFIPFLAKHFQLMTDYPYLHGLPFTAKRNEEPLRIIHFLILMYTVVFSVRFLGLKYPGLITKIKKSGQPIIHCGQNSIYIFSLGLLLSYLFGYVISYFGNGVLVWIPVNITGIILILLAANSLASGKIATSKQIN